MDKPQRVTFSFGKNWYNYSKTVNDNIIESAKEDILHYISKEEIENKSVLDIGCGSGLHSLAFNILGANSVFSFDYDVNSVKTSKILQDKYGKEFDWKIEQGSILNEKYLSKFDKADIVYSWGVLHHTGDMWNAIKNASDLVKIGGLFFISIYAKGPKYPKHLKLKIDYNESSLFGKKIIELKEILKLMRFRYKQGKNPLKWNEKLERGMNTYHDLVDWLGGYPYEVATIVEISEFLSKESFKLKKVVERNEGGCHRLLFVKTKSPNKISD